MEERLSGPSPRGARRRPAVRGELLAQVAGGVATVTLNRPAKLNALSFGMLEGLASLLDEWERDEGVRSVVFRGAGPRAFCAGGDIREIHDSIASGDDHHHEFFRLEYSLDYRIHLYAKPIVAIMDGVVMGGGMGISQGAALRVVGDRTRMAMPETAIGLFPDVGGSYFLSRTPGRLGLCLGLTGATLGAHDALYAGLADELAEGARPAPGELERLRPAIERHFGAGCVRAIVASLEAEDDPRHRDWAARTAAELRRRSPTMLEVTFEQLRRGAQLTLAECLRMELNLMHGCFEHPDPLEGIRARIIDKDDAPRWSPARLEEVRPESIDRFFAPRWDARRHPLAMLESTRGRP